MKFRNGSALLSTLASVACMAAVGVAGFSITTGESVCSLLASCDSKATKTTVVAASDSTSNCGAGVAREAALVAMVSDASECATATSCDGAKTASAWTMAPGGALIIPAALVTADTGECATATAKSCSANTTVVNAALATESCETAKASCESGATVVNAAVAGTSCETAKQSDCESKTTVVNAALATTDCKTSKASCEGDAKVVKAAQSDCSTTSSCEQDATVINAALATTACEGEAKSDCQGEAKVVNAAAGDCSASTACDEGATVVNAAVVATECGEAKSSCEDGAKVVNAAQTDCSSKASCDEGATVVNAAQATESCDSATKANCDSGATVVNSSATSEGCATTKTACSDAGASDAVVMNAALAPEVEGATKACCQDAGTKEVVNVAVAAGECEAMTDECAEAPMQTSPHEFKTVNASCPLTEEPITPGLASVHEGFTVGFCCNGCKRKWDARTDAEKAEYVVATASFVNEMCPTCPTMAPKKTSVSLFNGFAVGFCGDHCKSAFDKKDDTGKTKYIASLVAPVNASCPFSGETADNNVVVAYRGFTVAFCCDGCQSRFTQKITDAERSSLLAGMIGADAAMVVPAAETQVCEESCSDKDCGESCA